MGKNSEDTALRGIPFRAPPESTAVPEVAADALRRVHPPSTPTISAQLAAAAAAEARLRRWLFYLLFALGWAVVALIVLGLVTTRLLFPRNGQSAAVAEAGVNPGQPVPLGPADPKDAEALNGLVGVHLYQSYLNIGVLADATEEGAYSPAEANKLLDRVTGLMDRVDRQLNRLEETGKVADSKSLERTRRLEALLRTQAGALRLYWATTAEEHATRYHKAREEAWTGITELLGIKE
jgi:hypothetical protein